MATLNAKEIAVTPTHAVVMAPVESQTEPQEAHEWTWIDTAKAVAVILATIALILFAPAT